MHGLDGCGEAGEVQERTAVREGIQPCRICVKSSSVAPVSQPLSANQVMCA
jgi:hypothetical protein